MIIRNARIVNRGRTTEADLLIEKGRIAKIAPVISQHHPIELDAAGCHVLPGIIDDQVHFREPGLTHKASIGSESRAAVAGGVTSFMEMPNVNPPSVTQALLEEKYQIAARDSLANYSFYMGTTNDNLEEVLRTDPRRVCGVKVFMGSSTGNMLVDDARTL
ncbi:MAG TPA: dihydroorotase, partial [Saprospiraceae bacterium]|nr:dihydroorotase [Saprospiraceae bacterium]